MLTQSVTDASPDLIVVTGDLVHIGLASELIEAREWLERLGSPETVMLIPGNHDCYQPDSWASVKQILGPYLGIGRDVANPAEAYPVLRPMGSVCVIGACSAEPRPWWSAGGTLGDDQRRRLKDILAPEASRLRLLALHHPPLVGMTVRRKALSDAAQLEDILCSMRPEIVVHGHLHHNRIGKPPYGHVFCTAAASSARTDAPASYRVFDIAPTGAGWQITMTLKSRLHEAMQMVTQASWHAGSAADVAITQPGST